MIQEHGTQTGIIIQTDLRHRETDERQREMDEGQRVGEVRVWNELPKNDVDAEPLKPLKLICCGINLLPGPALITLH